MNSTTKRVPLYPGQNEIAGEQVTLYPGQMVIKGEEFDLYPGYTEIPIQWVIPASIYPIWWDTTVTVYNKFVDSNTQVVTWYRTVIEKCFWSLQGTKISVGEVVLDSKSAM